MEGIQLENGHTRIANELLEAMLVVSIPARHKDIWWFVVRKTYGFGKKQDYISLTQFEKGTRIDRSGVCKILKDLVAWKLLVKKASIYAINKQYSDWVVAWRPLGGSGVQDNQVVAYTPHTKETLTKEIILASSKKMSKESKINMRNVDSDTIEEVITLDGDKVDVQPKGVAGAMRNLLKWGEDRRQKKFVNYPKQYKAMKLMKVANISPTQIKDRWVELEGEKYWRDRGFDFMDVASSFDKR